MEFRTAYSGQERHHTAHGERFETVYIMQFDKNGHKYLTENGKKDVQEVIQSNLESTKINNIIRRFDAEILKARANQFMDITKMPQTLMDAQNLMIRMNDTFAKLSVEERAKFNHSPEQYIAAMEQEWADKQSAAREAAVKKEEVTADAE